MIEEFEEMEDEIEFLDLSMDDLLPIIEEIEEEEIESEENDLPMQRS
ncbi:MAG TPA: hypothetical protein PKH07_13075 [bacterium]|nr:hypothetical protein [bacterium]